MRKGVSPVVASVLIIAAVIIIGVVATTWVSSYVGQRTASASAPSCTLTTAFTVTNVEYDTATGLLDFKVTNTGSDTISNFTVEYQNSSLINRTSASSPSQTANVTAGQSVLGTANITLNAGQLLSAKFSAESCKNFYVTVRQDEITVK